MNITKHFFSFLSLILSLNAVAVVVAAGEDPFTPKAYLIRYWKKQISNNSPPEFILNKASPLTAIDSAKFSKLASQNAISTQLPAFCSSAKLLCFPDLSPSLEKHPGNVNFKLYQDKNFTNYGSGRLGGLDSFKNYSGNGNVVVNSFRRYSRDATGSDDKFANYAPATNVPDEGFNTYGTKTTGGAGDFTNYGSEESNVPNLHFTSYSDDTNGRIQKFTTYATDGNAGQAGFKGYGKNGNGAEDSFTEYGNNTNVASSSFSNYGESANGANDTFISYGQNGNVPGNNFNNYEAGGNAATTTFSSYRDQSNVGADGFTSYAKSSNGAEVKFTNYAESSFNVGPETFKGYGGGTNNNQDIGFKIYGVNNTFKDYAKKSAVSFAQYTNATSSSNLEEMKTGKKVNRWVEPGKFFRESMLKTGTVMPMPDIKDKMPQRSFLPRVISSKFPFSTSKLTELKSIFHADDESSMEKILSDALAECERASSHGETKRCVGSGEDMIDFATSVLGRNVVARTTENTNGAKQDVVVGSIKKINGGKVTKSVSCHQSLYPYLLYYCHSVPKVRVYEADLLDPKTKSKINHGVAICHIDTSDWSATHGAFIALGSGPGKIEVCHWIFENDLTWAIAD